MFGKRNGSFIYINSKPSKSSLTYLHSGGNAYLLQSGRSLGKCKVVFYICKNKNKMTPLTFATDWTRRLFRHRSTPKASSWTGLSRPLSESDSFNYIKWMLEQSAHVVSLSILLTHLHFPFRTIYLQCFRTKAQLCKLTKYILRYFI